MPEVKVPLSKEERRIYKAAYYLANRERLNAKNKAWYATHKEQQRVISRNYYLAHREELAIKNRQWRLNHPGRKRDTQRVRQRAMRGVTAEYFEEMLSAQEWCCAICGAEITETAAADHDHDSGMPRGILCLKCNTGIGFFGDDQETVIAAANYLGLYS